MTVGVGLRRLVHVLLVKETKLSYISMKNIFMFIIAALYFLLPESIAAESFINEKNLPVPNYAKNINRLNLGRDSFSQVDFWIDLGYKSENIMQFYEEFFVPRGWKICAKNGESLEQDTFLDSRGVEISQQMKYFLAPQEERLIVIGIRRVVESSTSNDKDSHQNVSIMVYKNHIPKILNALSLVCD